MFVGINWWTLFWVTTEFLHAIYSNPIYTTLHFCFNIGWSDLSQILRLPVAFSTFAGLFCCVRAPQELVGAARLKSGPRAKSWFLEPSVTAEILIRHTQTLVFPFREKNMASGGKLWSNESPNRKQKNISWAEEYILGNPVKNIFKSSTGSEVRIVKVIGTTCNLVSRGRNPSCLR